jgi:aminopeptidase N
MEKDPHTLALMLSALAKMKDKKDEKLFTKQLNTSESYVVQAAALQALATVNPKAALSKAQTLESTDQSALSQAVVGVYGKAGGASQWNYVRDKFDAANTNGKFSYFEGMGSMLARLDDPKAFAEDVDRLKELAVKYKKYGVDQPVMGMIQAALKEQAGKPNAAANQAVAEKAIAEIQAAK